MDDKQQQTEMEAQGYRFVTKNILHEGKMCEYVQIDGTDAGVPFYVTTLPENISHAMYAIKTKAYMHENAKVVN